MALFKLRYELENGDVKWRFVNDLRHETLCAAGGLHPAITWFDASKGFRDDGHGRDTADCVIHQGPLDAPPKGRIQMFFEGERFADRDPFEDLKRLGCSVPLLAR